MALEGGDTFETVTRSTTYLNNTLRPYSTYNFSVAAATSVGTGPFSPVITVNTPEAGMSFEACSKMCGCVCGVPKKPHAPMVVSFFLVIPNFKATTKVKFTVSKPMMIQLAAKQQHYFMA